MKEMSAPELPSWLPHCKFTETHLTESLQWLHFKVCKFHSNKTKSEQAKEERVLCGLEEAGSA